MTRKGTEVLNVQLDLHAGLDHVNDVDEDDLLGAALFPGSSFVSCFCNIIILLCADENAMVELW